MLLLALVAPVSVAIGSIATALVVAAGLFAASRPRGRGSIRTPIGITLLALLAITALATAASPFGSRWDKLVDENWIKLLVLAIPALALPVRRVERAVLVFLAISTLVAVYAIVQHFTGADLWRGGTTNVEGDRFLSAGFFGHHLTYGGHVLVAWCCAVALAIAGARNRQTWILVLAAASIVLTSLALLWSQARSAQIGALVSGVVFVLTAPRGVRPWLLGGGAVAIAAAWLTPTLNARFAELTNLENEATRLNLWRSAWHGILDRPWLGYGPGNFGAMMQLHEVEGFYDSKAHTHQDYLMHAVNAGVVGLLAALGFLGALFVPLARSARDSWVVSAAMAALAGLAAAGFFQVFQSDDEVEFSLYFLVGCGLAWAHANARLEASNRAPATPHEGGS